MLFECKQCGLHVENQQSLRANAAAAYAAFNDRLVAGGANKKANWKQAEGTRNKPQRLAPGKQVEASLGEAKSKASSG